MLEDNVKLPGSLNAQGKIKIELMDAATGDLVDKSETHNFISKGMEALYQIQMKNLFQRGRFSGGYGEGAIADPFRRMHLTDADHDADPDNEWIMRGSVIGSALTTTDLVEGGNLAGQYNAVESFTSEKQVRVVIDFPASAANGSINSVYFHADGSLYPQRYNDPTNFKPVVSGMVNFVYYNNKIYAINDIESRSGTQYSDLTVMDMNFNVEHTARLSSSSFSVTRPYRLVSSMLAYNNRIYFIGDSFSSGKSAIWSIPISEIYEDLDYLCRSELVIEHVVFDYTNTNKSGFGFTYNPDNSTFLIVTTVGGIRIIVMDTDFNVLNEHALNLTSTQYQYDTRCMFYHEGVLYMGKYTIDMDTWVPTVRGYNMVLRGITPEGFLIGPFSIGGDAYTFLQPKVGFSSRARLSSPVVKTSTNTMKVTYDFMLPSFFEDNY